MASGTSSGAGMGGMRSKIEAVQICVDNQIPVDILSVTKVNKIPELVIKQMKNLGTHFLLN